MERIESIKNKKIKSWKKLLTKKGRQKSQKYIIEGFHLVEEAIKADVQIDYLLISENLNQDDWLKNITVESIELSEEVSAELSDTETPQGIYAILPFPEPINYKEIDRPYLFLDAVQDPGNVGTLIRSADAAGFGGVVLGEGSADLFNPKTLRSAQGSHFHLNIYHGDLISWIRRFQSEEKIVYGTALDERAVSYIGEKPETNFALIVGNEGAGVNSEVLKETDKNLYIPIKGQAESLNVAIAASILMFSLYQ
ncbi:RNA methyltransferase [Marinilactibacillus sp. 15R]|uniref:RNA methyltransferase, TrmH family n=1 Tax=Marinilactibacillus piezotolerans TaxID=258723 RepID=A0A1I3Y0Q2_9LACT|nr:MULTISPECIES: RNA methyltransferase [Marinilactibacillus]API89995.1 RNA methyltransferase [Marinilactibacillus sp. 15R]SFK25414.1 RNA methyltransferase, TrmH family [Marinilactibacillus piezotolerans]